MRVDVARSDRAQLHQAPRSLPQKKLKSCLAATPANLVSIPNIVADLLHSRFHHAINVNNYRWLFENNDLLMPIITFP
jgi:hypothetical protein